MNLFLQPIHTLHKLRLKGEISARDIAQSVLQRIEQVEGRVKAFLHLRSTKKVLEEAKNSDMSLDLCEMHSPLSGLPIGLKDVFSTKGIPTTCGSHFLEGYVPPYDATVSAKLKQERIVLIGKNNMDEFAMGSSTEHSAFGNSHNPWDLARTPGGSSGGSAAAVAAGECLASIGTDTGGSVRQPAAYTGIVGLKPTYGRVSRYGMIAFASSFDVAGILCRGVYDAALLLKCLAGHDPKDSTSAANPAPEDYPKTMGKVLSLKGLRVGMIKEFGEIEGVSPAAQACFAQNVRHVQLLGARVSTLSLPRLKQSLAAYYILAPSEASSNLGRYDGVRYGVRGQGITNLEEHYQKSRSQGFGAEVKRRIMLGVFCLSAGYHEAYYAQAMRVRALLRQDFQAAFETVDVLMSPTTPSEAFCLGKIQDPLEMYNQDVFTLPANLAGIPAISIPAGLSKEGLPLGLQLMAAHFQETTLLGAAYAIENTLHPKGAPCAPLV